LQSAVSKARGLLRPTSAGDRMQWFSINKRLLRERQQFTTTTNISTRGILWRLESTKIRFRLGLCPGRPVRGRTGLRWGSSRRTPDTLVSWEWNLVPYSHRLQKRRFGSALLETSLSKDISEKFIRSDEDPISFPDDIYMRWTVEKCPNYNAGESFKKS